jgi:hypothetical protein
MRESTKRVPIREQLSHNLGAMSVKRLQFYLNNRWCSLTVVVYRL